MDFISLSQLKLVMPRIEELKGRLTRTLDATSQKMVLSLDLDKIRVKMGADPLYVFIDITANTPRSVYNETVDDFEKVVRMVYQTLPCEILASKWSQEETRIQIKTPLSSFFE